MSEKSELSINNNTYQTFNINNFGCQPFALFSQGFNGELFKK